MSKQLDDGGQQALKKHGVFPCQERDASGMPCGEMWFGINLEQYAAIHLRVPNSGVEWLDDMIREAKRDEMAGKALAGMSYTMIAAPSDAGRTAYEMAKSMLAARRQENKT